MIEHLNMSYLDEPRLYGVIADSKEFNLVWEDAESLLQDAINHSNGEFNLLDIKENLINKKMQLWVVYDKFGMCTACITQIIIYPRLKKLTIVLLGGKRINNGWLGHIETIQEFAKSNGCQFVDLYGRPGWEKALKRFGYKKNYVVMKLDFK